MALILEPTFSSVDSTFDESGATFDGTCLWCTHMKRVPFWSVACHRAEDEPRSMFFSFRRDVLWMLVKQYDGAWKWCDKKVLEIPRIPLIEILEDGTRIRSGESIEIPNPLWALDIPDFLPKRS